MSTVTPLWRVHSCLSCMFSDHVAKQLHYKVTDVHVSLDWSTCCPGHSWDHNLQYDPQDQIVTTKINTANELGSAPFMDILVSGQNFHRVSIFSREPSTN